MANPKQRRLEELYRITGKLSEPKITSILLGSHRMQGPMDVSDHGIEIKEAASADKILVEESIQHSFDGSGPVPILKSRACDEQHHTSIDTSNLASPSLSRDSFSENGENKAAMGASNPSDTSLLDNGIKERVEERVLECHGDNISRVSAVKSTNTPFSDCHLGLDSMNASCCSASTKHPCTKDFEKVKVEITPGTLIDCSCDREGDNQDPKRLNISIRDPFWKKSHSDSSTATVDCSHDSDLSQFPSLIEGNASPKAEVPSSHSRSTYSVVYRAGYKDLEENSSSWHRTEPSECSMEHIDTSLVGPMTTNGIDGKKSAAPDPYDILPCPEVTKSGHNRSNSSARAVMKVYPCLETENSVDLPPAVAEKREPPSASQQTSESEHSRSDILDVDVKVCDICGDAGREYLLAVCSRCNDGAEHTYCMQTKLDKVPEGDWLCEECKLKEDAETQTSNASESVSISPKQPSLNEKIQNSKGTFNLKVLSKSDTKVLGIKRNRSFKAIPNSRVPVKIHSENVEAACTAKKQVLEMATGFQGTVNAGKKPALSQEISVKNMDTGKVKLTHSTPLVGSHSVINSQETGKSVISFGPNSSMMQTQLQSSLRSKLAVPSDFPSNSESGSASPKATVLSKVPDSPIWPKSNAFQNLNPKPIVKQVWEDASQKQNVARESTNSGIKKEVSIRTSSKPMFNSVSSMGFRSNSSEPKSKIQNSNLSSSEELRGLKQAKEHSHSVERKNSFKSDHSPTSSSLTAAGRISHPKADLKSITHGQNVSLIVPSVCNRSDIKATEVDGSLKTSSGPTVLALVKGSENIFASAGSNDKKKQLLSHSGDFENGTVGNLDTCLQDGLSPSNESSNTDGKSQESFMPGGRAVRCYKCQEIGHIAQYCNSNLGVSAVMASTARSLMEVTGKSKWKHAVEAPISMKTRIRLPDRADELSVSNTSPSFEKVSKDHLSNSTGAAIDNAIAISSTCIRRLPCIEGTLDAQGSLRIPEADYARISTGAGTKQHAFANSSKTLAVPERHYLWKGGFEVQRSGRLPDFFDGIQAHLSTFASPKVLKVANKFPCKLQLEEVPCLSSWPKQFQGNCATEDNIALYFFAKDVESYERSYKKLLESMLKNGSTLKGDFDGIELLIFPSNRLPEKSHCWNRLFFLWGVFRERKGRCPDHSSASFKKLPVEHAQSSILDSSIMDGVSISQKISSYMHMDGELSKYDEPLGPLETAISSVPMDLPLASSPGRDHNNCCGKVCILDKKSSPFCNLDHSVADDTVSSEKHSSCSVPETYPCTSLPPAANLNDTGSSSRVPMSNTPMCSEVKSNRICLKEVYRDIESRKDTGLHTSVQATNVQSSLGKGKSASMIIDASNCRQAGFLSSVLDKHDTSSDSSKVVPISLSSSGREADLNDSRGGFKDLEPEQIPVTLKEKDSFKDNSTNLGTDMQRRDPLTKEEHSSWELRSNKKCLRSHSSEMASETSGEMDTSQTITWKCKSDCLSMDCDNNHEKLKGSQIASHMRMNSRGQNLCDGFLSAIQDHRFLNAQDKGDCVYDDNVIPEKSITAERYFFPVDLGYVKDSKSCDCNPWPMFLTNDENPPESDAPNLELALGAEKKSSDKGILPLFVQFIDKEGTREKPSDHMAIDDTNGDLSSSLSLSLAFPFAEKETVKPVSRTEQLLPDKHHVNTSLLLFGGYTDT